MVPSSYHPDPKCSYSYEIVTLPNLHHKNTDLDPSVIIFQKTIQANGENMTWT